MKTVAYVFNTLTWFWVYKPYEVARKFKNITNLTNVKESIVRKGNRKRSMYVGEGKRKKFQMFLD